MIDYNKADFETAFGTVSQLSESDIPEIVFSGRSNVGKSSLINKLFNRKALARVSSTPGKTITINYYRAGDVRFADLPGYGFAKRSEGEKRRWADLMEHYFDSERNIMLVVQLIDVRHTPSNDDLQMLDYLKATGKQFVIALTKTDKLKKSELEKRLRELENELEAVKGTEKIPFSAVTGEGVARLKEIFEAAVK